MIYQTNHVHAIKHLTGHEGSMYQYDRHCFFCHGNPLVNSEFPLQTIRNVGSHNRLWIFRGILLHNMTYSTIIIKMPRGKHVTFTSNDLVQFGTKPLADPMLTKIHFYMASLRHNKQRVLMHGHQGWNVRHGLCHIYVRYVYIYMSCL